MSGTYIYILFYCFYSFLVYNKIIIILYFFECLENELKNVWYKMRGKFVRINLKKSRVQPVSVTEEVFYNNLIFIEDFISHKNADVFKTINKKEIINDTYDRIMGNTYNELDENMGEELNLDNERNNYFEDTSDTEELIILEGHEDVVYQFLNSKKNSKEKTTNSPLVSVSNDLKDKDFTEIRKKNEDLTLNQSNVMIQECTSILNAAIADYKDEVIQRICFEFIVNKIEHFCKICNL